MDWGMSDVILLVQLLSVFQIKQTYTAIETYRNQSGAHWDNDRGANIVGDAADMVWMTYVKSKVRHCSTLHANGSLTQL